MHVVVPVGQKRLPQRSKDARFIAVEIVGEDQVQCGACLRVIVIMPLRLVPAAAGCHLFRRQAEEKEIFFARFLRHLDGRTIASADGQRAIHHELHVAGAAGFVAGGRNLIGNRFLFVFPSKSFLSQFQFSGADSCSLHPPGFPTPAPFDVWVTSLPDLKRAISNL